MPKYKRHHLHVKTKFHLGLKIAVEDLEEAEDELAEVHVTTLAQIEHGKEALSQNARQLGIADKRDLINSFSLVSGLTDQVLVDVFEVWDGDVLLELVIFENFFVDEFDVVHYL